MSTPPDLARIGALIGDPSRAVMLAALRGGTPLTAGELARLAGIAPSTASEHIARLCDAGLVRTERQGRHAFTSLAGGRMQAALDGLLTAAAPKVPQPGPPEAALRHARRCYGHLAGTMGVQAFASLKARGGLEMSGDLPDLTPAGRAILSALGIDLDALQGRGAMCRSCFDWSHRAPHLAGKAGRGLLARLLDLGWLEETVGSRTLAVTPQGQTAFDRAFPAS